MKNPTVILQLFTIFLLLNLSDAYRHKGNDGNYNTHLLKLVYSWKSLEFDYPNEAARQEAIKKGEFIPGDPVPIDVDVIRGKSTHY